MNDDCLFCKLYREGDHVAATDGFVAIRDINPQAPVHLLVLPERHVDSFREIGEFPPDEAKRMLEFVADVAAARGPDGLPCRRQRRPERRADGLPSPLARHGRLGRELDRGNRRRDQGRHEGARRRAPRRAAPDPQRAQELREGAAAAAVRGGGAAGPAARAQAAVEAAEAFRAGGREEQAEAEERELEILEEFMPEPLSEDEIDEIVDDVIAEVGATSMADLGRVMADVMPQIAGRADGSQVSQIVREKLA